MFCVHGTPRKLGAPGEDKHKVFYRLIDAASYQNNHILVVGGGDSAIEASLGLSSQKNNTVTLSYRKNEFSRIKERNRIHIDDFMKRKKVNVVFESEVKEILDDEVILQTTSGEMKMKNDYVFIFAGGELPGPFLKQIGVEMQVTQIQ